MRFIGGPRLHLRGLGAGDRLIIQVGENIYIYIVPFIIYRHTYIHHDTRQVLYKFMHRRIILMDQVLTT